MMHPASENPPPEVEEDATEPTSADPEPEYPGHQDPLAEKDDDTWGDDS